MLKTCSVRSEREGEVVLIFAWLDVRLEQCGCGSETVVARYKGRRAVDHEYAPL
jgi:hypothetical protein